ncbi:MAG: sensory transduction histidine kinase [Ferruginibacter sp.]|nr:sensory transduction histidine kinase [Ferruginibacter sp.]
MFNTSFTGQVQTHFGNPAIIPPDLTAFFNAVSESYNGYEEKIKTLENAVLEGNKALQALNERLLKETADLKNVHNELSRIFNQVNEGFFSRDMIADKYIHMSVGCEKTYGYSIDEFYNNNLLWLQVIHPDDLYVIEKESEQLQQGVQTLSAYRIVHKDQSIRWIEVKAIPEVIGGRLVKVEGIVTDITARKVAEILLLDSEAKYRSFFENNLDGVLLSKPDGAIEEANPAACEIYRATQEEICSFTREELLNHGDHQLLALLEERNRVGKVKGEVNFKRRDGTTFAAEIASSIFKDANGKERTCIILRDITNRKRAEAALLMSERKLDLIYNTVADSIFMVNTEAGDRFRFVSVNSCFLKSTGLQRENVIGKFIEEVIPSPSLELALDKYALSIHLQQSVTWEEQTSYPSGIKIGIVTINPVLDENGNCISIIGSVHDITERKKGERRIADSERRYRAIFEQNLAGIIQTKPAGEVITCNQACADMLGFTSPAELLHCNANDFYFSVSERNKFISLLKEQKKLYNYEGILKHRTGKPLHIIENISLFEDPVTGEEICDGMMIDITERKKAESMLKESEERYRQIVETTQEGIWMLNSDLLTVFVNKKLCELIGYSAAEMLGKPATFFMGEEGRKIAEVALSRRRGGFSDNFDIPYTTKSGSTIWTNLSASPILNGEGEVTGALAMVTDITKRKMDQELIRISGENLDLTNRELKRKNTELQQFAYVASHDLQEPLRTMASFVQLLKQQYEGKLDGKADKYLNFISDSSNRMKVLINDLLDYSRIGSKNEMEIVDCNKILQVVIADLHTAITDSSAEINWKPLPVIKGYPTEIKQLFQNLVINAIKFRKKATIPRINISAERNDDRWTFAFSDNGIGIDKSHSERIFIIFQRLHTRSEYQGSGIGLSHCKKIVELHHGKIWVDSVKGEGSTFYFTIPGKNIL